MGRSRIHDSSMNIALPSELHEKLKDTAWQERKTLSAFCREIIELGMKQHESGSDEKAAEKTAVAST